MRTISRAAANLLSGLCQADLTKVSQWLIILIYGGDYACNSWGF